MNRLPSSAIALLGLGASITLALACSAVAPPAETTSSASGGGAPSSTGIGAFSNSGGSLGAGGCAVCSPDLHSIVDCDGNVLTTCPDDKGCSGMSCVAPCDAARDNASTVGCEFYSVLPAPDAAARGSCFAAVVANTWTTPITLQVDYGGTPLDVAAMARTPVGNGFNLTYAPLPNGELAPGQVAILFLSRFDTGESLWVDCPAGITPGIDTDPSLYDTGFAQSFHITASAPVIAYDVYPYGGAMSALSSATLLVPAPAWGNNYIAVGAYPADPDLALHGHGLPFLQVVAAEDGTNVTIDPTAAIVGGGGVAAAAAGQPVTYPLAKGQVLQLLQSEELSGSVIASDKPISVWGGSSCMNIPLGVPACDAAHQELVPVQALGHEYVAARYRDRVSGVSESTPWTLVGAVDGTTLTYDPAPPANAPASLQRGQVARFRATDAFTVRSAGADHPFFLAAHMTGANELSQNPEHQGDPEIVVAVPPQEWLRAYLFFADPTYGNTNLVFVRRKAKDGTFKDVVLDCLGNVQGWAPVGAGGTYEVARVDLVIGGAPQGKCDLGANAARSEEPFGLTVWGWDVYASYAYPAGMGTRSINSVVVPPK
jgi:hypothetical protein